MSKPQPKLHTDVARLRTGSVKAQFWSVYVSATTDTTGDALGCLFAGMMLRGHDAV